MLMQFFWGEAGGGGGGQIRCIMGNVEVAFYWTTLRTVSQFVSGEQINYNK